MMQGCMGSAMGGSRLLIGCSISRFCSIFMFGGGDPRGIVAMLDLLVMGRGVVNLLMGLLVIVVARFDVTV